jgi:hypothetical protein
MDVTQISASVLGQFSLTGAVSSIGAATGKLGSATVGPFEYQESPTIQYQPLLGQALAAQVSTPISIDSLANLFDSDWPLATLLTLSVDRITPGYTDYFAAINALISLDQFGAIILTSETLTINESKGKGSDNQSKIEIPLLVVNFEQRSPRTNFEPPLTPLEADKVIGQLWQRFLGLMGENATNYKKLTVVRFRSNTAHIPVGAPVGNLAILRTRSALGVLQWASTRPDPLFAVIDEHLYTEIRENSWNKNCDNLNSFYTLTLNQERQEEEEEQWEVREAQDEQPGKKPGSSKSVDPSTLAKSQYQVERCLLTILNPDASAEQERELSDLRRYLLIIKSNSHPAESYAEYSDGKSWYYIANDDNISKRNFLFVSQILTIQAAPPTPLPLTPTITVGTH